jgi:hypothetical protein
VGGDVIRCEIMSKISFLGRISKEMADQGAEIDTPKFAITLLCKQTEDATTNSGRRDVVTATPFKIAF